MGLMTTTFGLLLFGLVAAVDTGNHPELPRWCGKVYQPEYPSFEPGGETVEPQRLADGPALDVRFRPRYSLYLAGEQRAEFIVETTPSPWRGQKWPGLKDAFASASPPPLVFTISIVSNKQVLDSNKHVLVSNKHVLDSNKHVLVSNKHVLVSGRIPVSSTSATDALFAFDLTPLTPRLEPYEVILEGVDAEGRTGSRVTAASELVYLPEKKTGSVTKLDNAHGGVFFRSAATGHKFEPFLPFGYYGSCDRFLCEKDYAARVKAYKGLGLNSMVSLTRVQDSEPAYRLLDELDVRYMYDLRGYYANLSAVREQVSVIRAFEGLYSYWESDEPDGHQYPLEPLSQARDLIRQLDPYHPVSVTLNCQNYYFEEYTAGIDILMEDVYPIGIDARFSPWGTPCNASYGDCGCDNCQGNVRDVSARLDDLARYETWLGLWPKTKAHNPQAIDGNRYWARAPTDEEIVAMSALAFHHGAKVIAAWVWTWIDSLGVPMGKFGAAVSKQPVRNLLVRGGAVRLHVKGRQERFADAACWIGGGRGAEADGGGEKGQVLVSVVNAGGEAIDGELTITLPEGVVAKSQVAVVWGTGTWTTGEGGGSLKLRGRGGMATNMIIVRV